VSLFTHDLIRLKTKLEAQFRMPVVLSLKTRRGYKAAYDRSYFEHLESLRSEGVLTIKHHATNLYSLISGSHLVIAYPFTSPPYIAEWLQVPSIYYDPTATLVRQHFGDSPSLVDFANTPDSLFAAASSAINSRLTKLIGSAKL
jgi:polysaccharide biosynthesis PFTS motif protein